MKEMLDTIITANTVILKIIVDMLQFVCMIIVICQTLLHKKHRVINMHVYNYCVRLHASGLILWCMPVFTCPDGSQCRGVDPDPSSCSGAHTATLILATRCKADGHRGILYQEPEIFLSLFFYY